MLSFLLALLCTLIIWFFVAGIRVREIAIVIGKRACERQEVQFLDDSVALSRVGLQRNGGGKLAVVRTYQFEFSDSGDDRRKGYVSMLGTQLLTLHMPQYETVQ